MKSKDAIFGLILAGGKSQRMGHDKSLIHFHDKPQREHLHDILKGVCCEVFVSCKTGTLLPPPLNPVFDQYAIDGPLNGILSAFDHNPSVAWLCVAVDMPDVSVSDLAHLIASRDRNTCATSYYDSDGQLPEPLLTLWEPSAALPLKRFFIAGNVSPRRFLMETGVKLIDPLNPGISRNINSPDDLRRYQERNR